MKTAPSWVAKGVRVQTPAVTKLLGKIDSPPHPLLGQPVCLLVLLAFLSPQHFLFKSLMAVAHAQQDRGGGTHLKLHGEHSMFS